MAKGRIKFKIQGHEKFALREGWLNKGLIIVPKNPSVFQGKSGADIFGIGNNMVKSLRYWMKAFRLMEEKPKEGAFLTELGELIADKDLYLEDDFTLWILHSSITRNAEGATSWYMYFNRCDEEELDKDQISQILCREITKYTEGQNFSEKSVRNDVDILLNMYSKSKEVHDPEDKNISPFNNLKLIKNSGRKYAKGHPDRRSINEWNILYELAVLMGDTKAISIEKAISDECGLKSIYQLTPIVINELLDKLDTMGYIQVDRTAGLDMIYKIKKFTPMSVLHEYYDKHR